MTQADSSTISHLVQDVAAGVAFLHTQGFSHPDLHGGNIILGPVRHGVPQVYFVDLHEVRQRARCRMRKAVADLARLNCSIVTRRRHRVAFLKTYLVESGIDMRQWKRWARAIERKSRALSHTFWRKHRRAIWESVLRSA